MFCVQHVKHQTSPMPQLHLPNHTHLKQSASGSYSSSILHYCLNAHHLFHHHSLHCYYKRCETTENLTFNNFLKKILNWNSTLQLFSLWQLVEPKVVLLKLAPMKIIISGIPIDMSLENTSLPLLCLNMHDNF
jgi:hypothetical protein